LLGFFCSIKCPGNVILRVFDLIRGIRDAGLTVIGGFHSPMEKECLDLLLRGEQPIVICPARSIVSIRLPTAWRELLTERRLLLLSPFDAKERRPTAELAERRNHLVAALADTILVAHATAGSNTERLCLELARQGKPVYTPSIAENAHLMERGIVADSINGLLKLLGKVTQ
jgi:predicted Rossmann fold nucleotide-binding protein DprA/Smf involved in DNA uptake